MSFSGIFLLLAFLMSIGIIVLWPLISHPAKPNPTTSSSVVTMAQAQSSQLQVQLKAILAALHELDSDHQTGKLTDSDYQFQREALVQRGIDTLTQIDDRLSDSIEAAIRARRHVS
jgi:hypothetical protein